MKNKTSGRPPKFNEESSPITVTLPSRVLNNLRKIDKDRAKAIVKCIDNMTSQVTLEKRTVEVIQATKDSALIIVPPSQYLKGIPWLKLIEVTPSRFLLVIPSGTPIETLELTLMDLIEHLPEKEIADKNLLIDLREKLGQNRRKDSLSKAEILFVKVALLFGLSKSMCSDFFSMAIMAV
jgi:hypothetical protein